MDEKENVLAPQEQQAQNHEIFTTEQDEPTLETVDTSDLEANLHKPAPVIEDKAEAIPAGANAAGISAAPEQQNAIDWMFSDTMSYFNSMVTGVNYYPELLSVMQGGHAQVSLHRRYMLKAIDEKWVNIVEDSLASLDVCIRNPRHYIEEIEEILPIELSRNISPRSVKHLAQHTDYISQIQGDEITPSKILNVFREDTIQTYENKFVNTLILRLFIFVNRRYEIALREGSDEKDTMLDFSNEFEHGETKGKVSVHLELDEKPTPGEVVKNYTYTTEIWKRVEKLNNIILTYMNSKFVEDMGKSYIRPPVMRTNALMKNKDLHQLLVLWEFINSYEGAGYSMLVQDELQNVDAKYQGALYATTAMQYLVFRDSVEHGFANSETLDERLTDKPISPEVVDKLPEETPVPSVAFPEGTPAEKAAKTADKNAPKSLRDPGTDPAKYRPKKLNAFERTVSLALEIALQTADKMEELNPYVPPVEPEEPEMEQMPEQQAAAQPVTEQTAAEQQAAAQTTVQTAVTTDETVISDTPVGDNDTSTPNETTEEPMAENADGQADLHEPAAEVTDDRNDGLGDADFSRDQKPMRAVPDMSAAAAAANAPAVAWSVDVDKDGDKDAVVDTDGDGLPDTVVVNDGNGITADSLIDHSIEVPDAKVDASFKATIHWSENEAKDTAEQAPKHRFSLRAFLRRKNKNKTGEVKRRG